MPSWTRDLQMSLPNLGHFYFLISVLQAAEDFDFQSTTVHAFGAVAIKPLFNRVSRYVSCFSFFGFSCHFKFCIQLYDSSPLVFVYSAQHGSQVMFCSFCFVLNSNGNLIIHKNIILFLSSLFH